MKKLQNYTIIMIIIIIIIWCFHWGELTMMKQFQFFYSILCEEQLEV